MQLYLNIIKEEEVARFTHRGENLITMIHKECYLDLLEYNPIFLDIAFAKDIANFLGITNVSLSRIIKRLNNTKSYQLLFFKYFLFNNFVTSY